MHDATALLAAVQAWALPADEGFAWCAGEAGTVAQLRRLPVVDKSMGKACVRAALDWKAGMQGHHEALDDGPCTTASDR